MTKIAPSNQPGTDTDYALKNLNSKTMHEVLSCGKTLYAHGMRFLENLPQCSAVSPAAGVGKRQAKTTHKST